MQELTGPPIDRIGRAALLVRILSIGVFIGMFVGTHIPFVGAPSISHMDKVLHFSAYLLLATCLLASWELTSGILQPPHYFMVWLVVILYGLFDEITQIPFGRQCDGLDWLADVAGTVAGLILFRIARSWMYRLIGVALQ
jgi:VanZ family protein